MNCRACGTEIQPNSLFCHKCGQRVDLDDSPVSEPPPALATGTSSEMLRRQNLADQPETVLWEGRYSSKAMIGLWALEGLGTLLLLVIGYKFPYEYMWWAILGILALVWGYTLCVYAYRRLSVRYRLTSQRFFHEGGILRHVTDRIEVIDMDDITTEQSLLQRFVNVGRIKIVSSDRSSPVLVLDGIENIHGVAQMLDDARRQERMKRGLHIEAI